MKKGILLQIGIAVGGPLLLVGASFYATSNNVHLRPLSATTYAPIVFDNSNSPTLSGGSASVTDKRGIVWEYSNAADYDNGHVTINHQGYFGISPSSPYGLNTITGITTTFTTTGDAEFWLLKSVDGQIWSEVKILESGEVYDDANNWRYVRFYNYATDSSAVNITSISLTYSCTGVSAPEDVDSAKTTNVITTSANMTYKEEYSDLSPNSDGGEAVSFTKTDSTSSWLVIGFGEMYKVGNVQNAKVEFDMKTSNINYGKYIQLMKNSETLGSAIYSDKSSAYKCTHISGDWYHIELPVTTVISTISGITVNGEIKDKPHSDVLNKEFNGVKINSGTCIIDNLRLTQSPCELGIFNNPTYKPAVNEFFWLKVAWVGVLYPEQVTITFSDDTLARHIPVTDPNLYKGSPFYIQLLGTGTFTATCTVVSGYNRQVHTIQHTITVK